MWRYHFVIQSVFQIINIVNANVNQSNCKKYSTLVDGLVEDYRFVNSHVFLVVGVLSVCHIPHILFFSYYQNEINIWVIDILLNSITSHVIFESTILLMYIMCTDYLNSTHNHSIVTDTRKNYKSRKILSSYTFR